MAGWKSLGTQYSYVGLDLVGAWMGDLLGNRTCTTLCFTTNNSQEPSTTEINRSETGTHLKWKMTTFRTLQPHRKPCWWPETPHSSTEEFQKCLHGMAELELIRLF